MLFKMMVIDDEQKTRSGIRNMIDWRKMDVDLCAEAANGLEAEPLALQHKPDIVLCDVKMPKMDGISFISRIRPFMPRTQIIFISGYSDKEYLKSAIRFGAVDYIDKPFEPYELIEAVDKAKKRFSSSALDAADRETALSLLFENEPRLKTSRLPIDVHSPLVTILIRFGPESNDAAGYEEPLEQNIRSERCYDAFLKEARRLIGEKLVMSSIHKGYIIHVNVPQGDLTYESLPSRLEKLFAAETAAGSLSISVGGVVKDSGQLKISYEQARTAGQALFFRGYQRVLVYGKCNQESLYHADHEWEDRFAAHLGSNQFRQASEAMAACMDEMSRGGLSDIPAIRNKLIQIGYKLGDRSPQYDQSSIIDHIERAATLAQIREYLQAVMSDIDREADTLSRSGRMIYDVQQYIQSHYSDELSIKCIARNVYLTPSYLCFLFKKTTGQTINRYIAEVRMEKAKEMLKNPTVKINEIASALGYANQDYFTRIFTKHCSMNPTKYRNSML